MYDLKHCPHCGCTAEIYAKIKGLYGYTYKWKVKCESYECGCSTPWMDTEKDAVDTWNKRVEDSD